MPIGLGYGGASRASDATSGFVKDGLKLFYALDESSGNVVKNLAPDGGLDLDAYTGIAMDFSSGAYGDSVAAKTLTNGQSDRILVTAVFNTGASTATGYIMGTASSYFAVRLYTSSGRPVLTMAFKDDNSATQTITYSATAYPALLETDTWYQIIYDVDYQNSSVTLHLRSDGKGPWTTFDVSGTIGGTAPWTLYSGGNLQVGANSTANGFLGDLQFLSLSLHEEAPDIDDVKDMLDSPNQVNAAQALGANSIAWLFDAGTGAVAQDIIGTNDVDISSGAAAWATELNSPIQNGLRRGYYGSGKPGVLLGTASQVRNGYLQSEYSSNIISSSDGWTLTGFAYCYETPSAHTVLFGLNKEGATTTSSYGAYMYASSTGTISSHVYNNSGGSQNTNSGVAYTAKGQFRQYSIVYDGTKVTLFFRGLEDDSESSVAVYTSDYGFVQTNRMFIGQSGSNIDACVAYVSYYDKALSAAERTQNFLAGKQKLIGNTIYVDQSASFSGCGSPESPYQTLSEALYRVQPSDTISISAGTYTDRITDNALTTAISSSTNISFIGNGDPVVQGSYELNYPVYLSSGSFYFEGIVFDGQWDGIPLSGTGAVYGVFIDSGVESAEFQSCTVMNTEGDSSGHSGSGFMMRSPYAIINNCIMHDISEHGIYLRRAVDADAYFSVSNCTIYNCNGRGIQVSNEGHLSNYFYDSCIYDVMIYDCGNGLALGGMNNCTIDNVIVSTVTTYGIQFGWGTDVTNDGVNVTNCTVNAAEYAIHDTDVSTNIIYRNLVVANSTSSDLYGNGEGSSVFYNTFAEDDTITVTSGDAAGAIVFTETGLYTSPSYYELDPTSSGYGLGGNFYTLSSYLQTDINDTARSASGTWNPGAVA